MFNLLKDKNVRSGQLDTRATRPSTPPPSGRPMTIRG